MRFEPSISKHMGCVMEYKQGELVLVIATGKIHTVSAVDPDGLLLTISDGDGKVEISVDNVEKTESPEGDGQKEFSDPKDDASGVN